MKIVDMLEGFRKEVKQMKRLKEYDILYQTIDKVLPTAKATLEKFEKYGRGDATDRQGVRRLMCAAGNGDEKAALLLTDPPYGVNYTGACALSSSSTVTRAASPSSGRKTSHQ